MTASPIIYTHKVNVPTPEAWMRVHEQVEYMHILASNLEKSNFIYLAFPNEANAQANAQFAGWNLIPVPKLVRREKIVLDIWGMMETNYNGTHALRKQCKELDEKYPKMSHATAAEILGPQGAYNSITEAHIDAMPEYAKKLFERAWYWYSDCEAMGIENFNE